MNKSMKSTMGSPKKGVGFFIDKSSTSSPTKASPKKSIAFSDNQTDMMSTSNISKMSPTMDFEANYMSKMLGTQAGLGVKGIL